MRSSSGHCFPHGGRASFVDFELMITSGPILSSLGPYIQYFTRFVALLVEVPPIARLWTVISSCPQNWFTKCSKRYGQAQSRLDD